MKRMQLGVPKRVMEELLRGKIRKKAKKATTVLQLVQEIKLRVKKGLINTPNYFFYYEAQALTT